MNETQLKCENDFQLISSLILLRKVRHNTLLFITKNENYSNIAFN